MGRKLGFALGAKLIGGWDYLTVDSPGRRLYVSFKILVYGNEPS